MAFMKNFRILNILTSQNLRCNITKKAGYYAAAAYNLAPDDRMNCELYAYSMLVIGNADFALDIVKKYDETSGAVNSRNLAYIRYQANLKLGNKDEALECLKELIKMNKVIKAKDDASGSPGE